MVRHFTCIITAWDQMQSLTNGPISHFPNRARFTYLLLVSIYKISAGWTKENGTGLMAVEAVSEQDVVEALQKRTQWLEDCVVHLLCVLALDRFADFVSDQVRNPHLSLALLARGCMYTSNRKSHRASHSCSQYSDHANFWWMISGSATLSAST